MNEDQALGVVYALMALVLVGSGLFVRRLPAGKVLKLALIWLGIFLVAFMIARLFA